jgi:hypothetical protein
MSRTLFPGARKLSTQHLTIRVPWHDAGWDGRVCEAPRLNTHCHILPRIAQHKRDEIEERTKGTRLAVLDEQEYPACITERGAFMADFPVTRHATHPYVTRNTETHGHFAKTPFVHLPYSAACIPFRWMLKRTVEGDGTPGLADALKLDYDARREPQLPFETSWVQDRVNQLVVLDTFFGAVTPETSLCFLYAKRTPLLDDPRRVIVGVGRVKGIGDAVEYLYKKDSDQGDPRIRSVLWERNVCHSITSKFEDGFLFPYKEVLAALTGDPSLKPEDHVAFAPDEYFAEYSYGSEHLSHDGAVASLIACASALRRISRMVPGNWDASLKWIDRELNRLWRARGPFPGLGSALTALGLSHGSLVAHVLVGLQEGAKKAWTEDPWGLVDQLFENPATLPDAASFGIDKTWRKVWRNLPAERRSLLKLLSRFTLSADQAKRFYHSEDLVKRGISITDSELLANPYRIYECDRDSEDSVAFGIVDRGLFPDPQVRAAFPVPPPSTLHESIDARRTRAVVIATLEAAALEGHTLLPRPWVLTRVSTRPMEPACPLSEDTLLASEDTFAPHVVAVDMAEGKRAFQLARYTKTRSILRDAVLRRLQAKPHAGTHDWAERVDAGIGEPLPETDPEREVEARARQEKTAALAELFSSRISVLLGAAGTGKTTLLRILCALPEVSRGGTLLLAPTGKARVRLEQATGQRGQAKTLAQFLLHHDRYDLATGRYYANANADKCRTARTVIIDECSMLTEEQLAALFDALGPVDRVILVGDPRQLPPIGAGRPFVDIVRKLVPADVETTFPRRAPGYAELTVPRRQKGGERDDLLLAGHFSGMPVDPGADEVWDRLSADESGSIRAVPWTTAEDLQTKLFAELARELELGDPPDESRFEQSIGGTPFGENGKIYFWRGRDGQPGAASAVDRWQVLDPVRGTLHGVEALNRAIQARFRKRAREMATPEVFYRAIIPKPMGPQGILWGDKVINLQNNSRRRTFPRVDDAYLANGEMGVVVGEYKTKNFKGFPKNLEVEFSTLPSITFKYWQSEFGGDDSSPQLELAYVLTVHKTQGSEFGKTFVVLPNPCRPLSRELLYTALTRHQQRIVLLHQGPLRELRRFSSEHASEIAQRLTNLFAEPAPKDVSAGKQAKFLESGLIHRTTYGTLVRSKSELFIAEKIEERLRQRGVQDFYEVPLVLANGHVRYPDFTIQDDITGAWHYWEHLGMLDNPGYRQRWLRKREEYIKNGILPLEDGGGPNGALIVTEDQPNGGLLADVITEKIEAIFGSTL